jgi:hypothetical protein
MTITQAEMAESHPGRAKRPRPRNARRRTRREGGLEVLLDRGTQTWGRLEVRRVGSNTLPESSQLGMIHSDGQ